MAHFTARPQIPFVHVIVGVAIIALQTCFLEDRRQMALLTRHNCVHADQGKITHVMLEADFLPPALFVMAIRTHFALLAFVDIIVLMTVNTPGSELLLLQFAPVTGTAQEIGMLSSQGKVRLAVMIELGFIPSCGTVA